MKNKIQQLAIVCALVMLGSFYVNAQNPFWTLPGQYFDQVNYTIQSLPIPILGPGDDPWHFYDGSPAQHAHNAIFKPNGDLLFFIVDHRVYDGNGLLIDEISFDGGASPDGFKIKGASEMVIIPTMKLTVTVFILLPQAASILPMPVLM